MARRNALLGGGVLLASLASACSSGDGSGKDGSAKGDAPTWYQDVAPLVGEKCAGCHTEGGIAPFSMKSYDTAKEWSSAMARATKSGVMPPFLAQETSECQPRLPWYRDLRLTDGEKDLLQAWADADAPEGDSRTAAQVAKLEFAKLEHEDVVMGLPEPVTVEGTRDIHTCVVVDPGLTEDSWVVGRLVTAGNSKVLHHVVAYALDPGKNDDDTDRTKAELAALVKSKNGAEVGKRYDCFGGPKLDGLGIELLDAWAPGSLANIAPPNSAQPLDKDSLVVLDIHYHPTGGAAEVDTDTKLSLMLTDEVPEYVSRSVLIGNFDERVDVDVAVGNLVKQPDEDEAKFLIPAGATDHVEEMTVDWKLPADSDFRIYGAGTHMHYVGRDERVTLERPEPGDEPANECLIETPSWNFNWQRGYAYDWEDMSKLPTMKAGDVMRLRCVYDNSPTNPFVVSALKDRDLDAPVDVPLGEDTLDEMCLVGLGVIYPNPGVAK